MTYSLTGHPDRTEAWTKTTPERIILEDLEDPSKDRVEGQSRSLLVHVHTDSHGSEAIVITYPLLAQMLTQLGFQKTGEDT